MGRPRHKISRRERRANTRDDLTAIAPVPMSVAPPVFDTDMTSVDLLRVAPYTPPAPRVDPLFDAEFPITESAEWARHVPGQRALRLHCAAPGCREAFGHGSTRSFTAMYGWASLTGWRQDLFGDWTCPACQMLPGYRTAAGLSPLGRDAHEAGEAEVYLAGDVHEAAGTPDEYVAALKAAA